jgi:hypothetical protein
MVVSDSTGMGAVPSAVVVADDVRHERGRQIALMAVFRTE